MSKARSPHTKSPALRLAERQREMRERNRFSRLMAEIRHDEEPPAK